MKNSTLERNLNKIGFRLSYATLTPKPNYKSSNKLYKKALKFLIVQGLGLASIALSWLYVAYVVIMFSYNVLKKLEVPETLKLYSWKMKNVNMSFDEIVRASMKGNEIPEEQYQEYKNKILDEMNDYNES